MSLHTPESVVNKSESVQEANMENYK
jgi:hypothetical protein